MTYDADLDEPDDDDSVEEGDPTLQDLRKQLRQSRKENKGLQAQLSASSEATKKLAFIEAKLPDDPRVQYFLDHYEGDYTAEAIREQAAKFGFINVDQATDTEVAAVEAMMRANQGSSAIPAPGTDDAMNEEIMQVSGPNSSFKIKEIMQRYGRYQEDE